MHASQHETAIMFILTFKLLVEFSSQGAEGK